MKKHFDITVFGKVQNVGFRFYTNKRAQEIGLSGYVKNLQNGSVYIEAEGDEKDLETFLDFIKRGPQWARVDKVDAHESPVMGYEEFRIK
jgi:acylphosphatase